MLSGSGDAVSDINYKAELDRQYSWLASKLPEAPSRWMTWLRRPHAVYVRVPLGVLLVLGGVFSFLPVLGLWMLPLGLILIAQDIPALQKPTAIVLMWIEMKWAAYQQRKRERVAQRERRD